MNYRGTIIEESLNDTSVLSDITILDTEVEQVTESFHTPWLTIWTLHHVEIPEEHGEEIAQRLSKDLENEHTSWYADFKNDKLHYIVFHNKIFRVDLANPTLYKEAKAYGLSLGIPEHQVDFKPKV